MGENPVNPNFSDHQRLSYAHSQPVVVDHVDDGALAASEEEPYTIKCICGFGDDDGLTVLCEQCNTWQHIECYYPSSKVPEIHQCADCCPRVVDCAGATHRQRLLRDPAAAGEERKSRRTGPKSHRKSRTKDPIHLAYTNGHTSHEASASDCKSASPREQQPPPAKRPKTSHKHSGSFNSTFGAVGRALGSRARSESNVALSSPFKSTLPERPVDYLSEDFLRVHQTNINFAPAHANLHLNIGVTNLLSIWLDDEEAFAEATNGLQHIDVFKQVQQPIEELESPVEKRTLQYETPQADGRLLAWPYLTVEKDLAKGDMVGELRGSLGRLEEYKADASNRWDILRHPDHFVFFHPHLPIYVDCRTEGTLLRYVRRSCHSNMELATFITGAREYRFCFTATADIPRGTEITIDWDVRHDAQLLEYIQPGKLIVGAGKEYIHRWVETVLSHFGGCACEQQSDDICLLGHFDRRLGNTALDNSMHPRKRSKKGKATIMKDTPPSTGRATNSRTGSEGHTNGVSVEDLHDRRSSTRSSRSGASRDNTPAAACAPRKEVGSGNELSEREKRKLRQQEKLFEQLEQETQQGVRKKKRNSGSNVNTPTAGLSKSLARSTSSASNPDTPAAGVRQKANHGDMSYFDVTTAQRDKVSEDSSSSKPIPHQTRVREDGQTTPAVAPTYVDASVQTVVERPTHLPVVARRPYVSLSQRLLQRSHLRKVQRDTQVATEVHSNPDVPTPIPSPPADSKALASPSFGTERHDLPVQEPYDSEMQDFEPDPPDPATPPSTWAESSHPLTVSERPLQSSHPPIKPPAPPWPSEYTQPSAYINLRARDYRFGGLHVDLPPPPLFNAELSGGNSMVATPGPLTTPALQRSMSSFNDEALASAAVMLSPGTPSLVQPSPVRKKMSLSDYMNKKKAPALEKTQSQSLQSVSTSTDVRECPLDSPQHAQEAAGATKSAPESTSIEAEVSGDAMVLD